MKIGLGQKITTPLLIKNSTKKELTINSGKVTSNMKAIFMKIKLGNNLKEPTF